MTDTRNTPDAANGVRNSDLTAATARVTQAETDRDAAITRADKADAAVAELEKEVARLEGELKKAGAKPAKTATGKTVKVKVRRGQVDFGDDGVKVAGETGRLPAAEAERLKALGFVEDDD